MAEKWQQWMPFHINEFRGSPEVQAMHPIARAGYLYLLASCWQTPDCTIPKEDMDLAALSGLGDELWSHYKARILRKFEPVPDAPERLTNVVCRKKWLEARKVFEARKKGASKINQQRYGGAAEENDIKNIYSDSPASGERAVSDSPASGERAVSDSPASGERAVSDSPASGERAVSERQADTITETLTGTEKQTSPPGRGPKTNLVKLYPPPVRAATDFEELVNSAMDELCTDLGFTDPRLRQKLTQVMSVHARQKLKTVYEVKTLMVQKYREYQQEIPLLRYSWGPETFFTHGHWLQPSTWPYDPKKLQQQRLRLAANLGVQQGK